MTPDNNPVQTDGGLIKTFKDILGISHRPIPVRHTHTTAEITEAGSGGTTSTLATILQGLRTLIAACEVLANKITSWGTPTNTQYPSAKLVKDSLDAKVDLDTTSHTVVLGDTPSVSGLDNETTVCEKVIRVSYARSQQSNVSDYAVLHVVETTRPSTKRQIVYLYNFGQVLNILYRTYSNSSWGSWSIKNMSLDVDTTPADDSDHLITSGAVYEGLAAKAPSSHTHTKSQITDFAHTHAIADVTGLQASLDGKADTSHTHTMGQVGGLVSALSQKEALSNKIDNFGALDEESSEQYPTARLTKQGLDSKANRDFHIIINPSVDLDTLIIGDTYIIDNSGSSPSEEVFFSSLGLPIHFHQGYVGSEEKKIIFRVYKLNDEYYVEIAGVYEA